LLYRIDISTNWDTAHKHLQYYTFQLRSQLIVIGENSTLNDKDLRIYLRHIQQECIEELRKAIEARRAATRAALKDAVVTDNERD
jgi:hypothetical protein